MLTKMLQQRLIQRVQVGEAFQVENRVAGERFQVAENTIHPCYRYDKCIVIENHCI